VTQSREGDLSPKKEQVANAYTLAADSYDGSAMGFWGRFGGQLVDLTKVKPGHRVLDLCCGSGASALAAARKTGPAGGILGVDIAQGLVELARAKATREGLSWAQFQCVDVEALEVPPASFDVGQCGFAIFFFDDMTSPIRTLLRAVRPRGTIGVSIWGEEFWEPYNTRFFECIRRRRPDLYTGPPPWYRINSADALAAVLRRAGATNIAVRTERASHVVVGADGWWQVMWGSGYRGTLSRLTPDELHAVRAEHLREIQPLVAPNGDLSLSSPVHFGIATVPAR
jgi:ubiquinone/menaquinone biosynthesis C-methylase UbiE